ncbi:putative cyclin B [Corchorus capsularis]|uniref:Putative cyclin B n=1 Tax=Corchorus capsularis TaxID=210143 RepID=A0A1R3IZP9_COCAP|nr:putative cyclin B [Corchorus capsularis]
MASFIMRCLQFEADVAVGLGTSNLTNAQVRSRVVKALDAVGMAAGGSRNGGHTDIVDEPILDMDGCDSKNPLAAVDYVEDLYAHYRKMESFGFVSPNYMAQQLQL